MSYSMLIDQTKCIGCSACTVSCKSIYEEASFGILRTRMKHYESGRYPDVTKRFRKHMCMHCVKNAPCIEVCPVEAISYVAGDDAGMVVIDVKKCIGCGNCTRSCPYHAPDQDKERKKAEKCTLCHTRVLGGEIPYCAEACPVGAIAFDKREVIIEQAKQRVEQLKAKGHSLAYLWGLRDTAVFYIIDREPAVYDLPQEGYTAKAFSLTKLATPGGGIAAAALLGGHGLRLLRDRRIKISEQKNPEPE